MEADLARDRVVGRNDDGDLLTELDHFFGVVEALEREIRAVDQPLEAGFEFDEGTEGLELGHLALVARADGVLVPQLLPGVGLGGLLREPQLSLLVDTDDLHLDGVADARYLSGLGAGIVA